MGFVFKFKRGRKSDLPTEANAGEPLITTDSNELFFGQGTGQPLIQINANKANSLQGQTCGINEINYLQGVNLNVQQQFNDIQANKSDKATTYSKTDVDNMYNHLMLTKMQITDFQQGVLDQINAQKGVINGLAPLNSQGQLDSNYIGSIGVGMGVGVNTQADQLALSQDVLIAIRADLNKSYVRNGLTTGTMSDWIEMKTPTGGVLSVAGKTGSVSLIESDIIGLTDDLDAKSDIDHQHSYNDLLDKPDLSLLHSHSNLNAINKISETNGQLTYNGQVIVSYNIQNNLKATAAPTAMDDVIKGYSPGSRWLDNTAKQEYVCVDNNVGYAVWKPTTNLDGDTGVPKLNEIDQTITVLANSSLSLNLDSGGFSKYDVRTIYAKSMEGNNIQITVYDKAANGMIVYKSLAQPEIYDIVNAPCADKDNDEKVHVVIQNFGNANTTVQLVIKITNLI